MFDLVTSSKDRGNANPTADEGENGQHHERKEHDPRRFVDAVGVAFFRISDHHGVAAGVSVDGSSVIVEIGMFLEVFGTEEGLEPETEHVERGDPGGDEADEPEQFADGVIRGEGAV